jgi:hypothetical protein
MITSSWEYTEGNKNLAALFLADKMRVLSVADLYLVKKIAKRKCFHKNMTLFESFF